MEHKIQQAQQHGLYSAKNEHDACGVGFVAHIKGNKSHSIIEQGLQILKNLDHRGAVGADPLMGDGAGILIQLPDQLYREEMAKQGVELPPFGEYGVGMVFLPKENASRIACEQEIERSIREEGQVFLGWLDVPVNRDMPMSPTVRAKEPVIRQVFIGRGEDIMVTDALERKLYVIRKPSGHAIQALNLIHGTEFFVPSMSARTRSPRNSGSSIRPSLSLPISLPASCPSCGPPPPISIPPIISRSWVSRYLAMSHPRLSVPTRFAFSTFTSSKNVSQNGE